ASPTANPVPAPAARGGSPIPPMIAEPVPVPEDLTFATAPARAGVEFVYPSISSDGFYEIVRSVLQSPTVSVGAGRVAEAVLGAINPHQRWMDGVGHGSILIDVTEERVQADFHLTAEPSSSQPDPRVDPAHRPQHRVSFQTVAGSRVTSEASGPVGPRIDAPRRAECAPEPTGDPTATSDPTAAPTATEAPPPTGSPSGVPSPTESAPASPSGSPRPSPSGTPSWPSAPPSDEPQPGGGSDDAPAGDLPRTGTQVTGTLGLGLAAVAGGLGLTFAARRRQAVLDDQDGHGSGDA